MHGDATPPPLSPHSSTMSAFSEVRPPALLSLGESLWENRGRGERRSGTSVVGHTTSSWKSHPPLLGGRAGERM